MKKLLLCLTLLMALHALAQDPKPTYNASKFGIRSDGVTMNTRSIQFAIDWIAEQGGGTLRFWVGRYLTGSIHMKSNVTIELMEGAVLVGSTNPFDYDRLVAANDHALILAEGVDNIRLIGVYNSGVGRMPAAGSGGAGRLWRKRAKKTRSPLIQRAPSFWS